MVNLVVMIPESEEMRQLAKTFQDLIVWQKAHQFILFLYRFYKIGIFIMNSDS